MSQKKILITEDEIPLRKALTSKLSHMGYLVMEAENGREAYQKALQNHPDLIIADIFMPEMNGLEFAKNLRQDEWGKTANIIFLTNLNNSDDVAKALEVGVSDYLVKSDMKLQDIMVKIQEKLAQQESGNTTSVNDFANQATGEGITIMGGNPGDTNSPTPDNINQVVAQQTQGQPQQAPIQAEPVQQTTQPVQQQQAQSEPPAQPVTNNQQPIQNTPVQPAAPQPVSNSVVQPPMNPDTNQPPPQQPEPIQPNQ